MPMAHSPSRLVTVRVVNPHHRSMISGNVTWRRNVVCLAIAVDSTKTNVWVCEVERMLVSVKQGRKIRNALAAEENERDRTRVSVLVFANDRAGQQKIHTPCFFLYQQQRQQQQRQRTREEKQTR